MSSKHLIDYNCEQYIYELIEIVKIKFVMLFFQDLGLGKFCCPRGNGQHNVCCNTDPNPPPSTAAPVVGDGKGEASAIQATAFTSSLIATLFLSWLM